MKYSVGVIFKVIFVTSTLLKIDHSTYCFKLLMEIELLIWRNVNNYTDINLVIDLFDTSDGWLLFYAGRGIYYA